MKDFIKKHKVEFNITVAMVFIVLMLVIVHGIGITMMMNQEVDEDLNDDVNVASFITYEAMAEYQVRALQGARQLGSLTISDENTVRSNGYRSAMSNAGRGFDAVYFATVEGKLFAADGRELPLVDQETFSSIVKGMNEGDSDTFLSAGFMDRGYDKVFIFSPVSRYSTDVGYFIGEITINSHFFSDMKAYLRTDSAMFLVDRDGNVITSFNESKLGDGFVGLNNILSYIQGMDITEMDVKSLNQMMKSNRNETLRLATSDETYELITSPVQESDGWKVLGIAPKSEFGTILFQQRKLESALLLFDIIVILLCLIISTSRSIIKERKMQTIAYTDPLTNVGTKPYFRKEGQRLLDEEDSIRYAVAAIDIVGFRYVNELFGHERGDEILRTMANMFTEFLQPKELLARNTADYFELLCMNPELFGQRISQITQRLNDYARSIDVTYPLNIRAGYSVAKTVSQRQIYELLDKANAARKMVDPKSGIFVKEYTRDIQDSIKVRDEIESTMESALNHEEFKLFLQPKFNVMTNQLAGAEALVRWIRRDGSMVYPDQFIPVFEANGFIERVDFYMLEKVCKTLEDLANAGMKSVPISVNQSRILLLNPHYFEKVLQILNRFDIPRNLVELELTETAFFDDQEKMIKIMEELKSEGCILDIDDFGSGYSSLNMLKDMPFDVLKIDRAFFGSEARTKESRIILEKVVELAHALGKKCICEGVETQEQVDLLNRIGCSLAQGYFYSKPIPVEEFIEKYLSENSEYDVQEPEVFVMPPKKVEETPAEDESEEEAPVEEMPVEEAPAEETPEVEVPADGELSDEMDVPAEMDAPITPEIPFDIEMPADATEADSPIVGDISVPEETPAEEAPVEETPEEAPEEAPVEEAPVEETPKEEAPEEETPAEEVPEETPAEEAPVEETPTEMPADTVPEAVSVEDAPKPKMKKVRKRTIRRSARTGEILSVSEEIIEIPVDQEV